MNRTLSIVIILAALATLPFAWWPEPTVETTTGAGPVLGDQVDPTLVAGLRVAGWINYQGMVRTMEVRRDTGGWTIPSADGFPVGLNPSASVLATRFFGWRFGRLVTSDRAQHAALGVMDPLAPWGSADPSTALGNRITVTLRDGRTAVDFIFGAVVPNTAGRFYARLADHDEVYTVYFNASDIAFSFDSFVESPPKQMAHAVLSMTLEPPGERPIHLYSDEPGSAWLSKQAPPGTVPQPLATQNMLEEARNPAFNGARKRSPQALADCGFRTDAQGRLVGEGGACSFTNANGLVISYVFGAPVECPVGVFQGRPVTPPSCAVVITVGESSPGAAKPELLSTLHKLFDDWIFIIDVKGYLRLMPPEPVRFMEMP